MQKKYFELKSMINTKDIKDIIVISKNIGAYQKSVQYSVYCYMSHLYKRNQHYDSVYLVASSILLGCKISNFIPKIDVLLENIFIHFKLNLDKNEIDNFREEIIKLELQMSVSLDFKFDIEDQYGKLRELGEKLSDSRKSLDEEDIEMNKKVIQSTWVFMNDSLFYPFRLFFDIDIILRACTYLSYLVNKDTEKIESLLSKSHEKEVQFIAEELLEGYENIIKK